MRALLRPQIGSTSAARRLAATTSMEVGLALESLAQTSPRDYLRRSGGRLLLHVLYTQCEAAGLLPLQEGGDDVSKLHALFSVAASHGMSLACDYLLEVRVEHLAARSHGI